MINTPPFLSYVFMIIFLLLVSFIFAVEILQPKLFRIQGQHHSLIKLCRQAILIALFHPSLLKTKTSKYNLRVMLFRSPEPKFNTLPQKTKEKFCRILMWIAFWHLFTLHKVENQNDFRNSQKILTKDH